MKTLVITDIHANFPAFTDAFIVLKVIAVSGAMVGFYLISILLGGKSHIYLL